MATRVNSGELNGCQKAGKLFTPYRPKNSGN